MRPPLPLLGQVDPIEWHIPEGGLGVVAGTDEEGTPFLGVYTLGADGNPFGSPTPIRGLSVRGSYVAGFRQGRFLTVDLSASIDDRGLFVQLWIPPELALAHGQLWLRSSRWSSATQQPHWLAAYQATNATGPHASRLPQWREFA